MAPRRKVTANRTLRPAGRPCGRERGFARCGGLCAWRVIARWLYRPFPAGFGRPGQAAAASDQRERRRRRASVIPAVSGRLGVCAGTAVSASDQRERFVQFRAAARIGSGAVAAARERELGPAPPRGQSVVLSGNNSASFSSSVPSLAYFKVSHNFILYFPILRSSLNPRMNARVIR